ncbi:imidazolonepropionase (plasmid) [Cetobacterium somerae]|uniref:imidazolonepropionase n=1 Tax=Cetobacterium somerae TaxID=188913 RepID=UPI001F05D9D2|nr:imidazolonepropionase [Cetobacterium somerae]UPO98930.1 imidazolonepropionase [Cetobacterium somerae]
MASDLLVYNIGVLITSKEIDIINKTSMENIEVLNNAYVAIKNGHIFSLGEGDYDSSLIENNTILIDAEKNVVIPGLIDSHTHLVHGGSRENEMFLKAKGATYMEILNAGGGILSTVKATKEATKEELVEKAKISLKKMLAFGVTTIESKSGYGLDLETEIKQLEVNQILDKEQPIDIVSTFMGAHAIPKEYKGKEEAFIKNIIQMLPEIKAKNLAEFCDIFCEHGIFSVDQSREVLKAAKKLGFKLKIHADEIESIGGAELAGELETTSSEHLMAVSDEGIIALKNSGVIANILPGTSFYLKKEYAPVRKMIDHGVQIALSTDYNPGSCPTENLQLIMQIAALYLNMSPIEIIKAVTINGAKSLNKEKQIGSIEIGKKADLVMFNSKSLEYILYHFGINHTKMVIKNGEIVYNI